MCCAEDFHFPALARFVNSPLHSDVKIVCGSSRFHAHRVVLASRCRFFERMFEGGWSAGQSNEVHVEDVDPRIMIHLLRFIYEGDPRFPLDDISLGMFVFGSLAK
jgi:BTB/POZ domain